jgi:hypothetical protein
MTLFVMRFHLLRRNAYRGFSGQILSGARRLQVAISRTKLNRPIRFFCTARLSMPIGNHSEPASKVVEQYQHVVIHASLRRDGVNHGMDWYCPAGA